MGKRTRRAEREPNRGTNTNHKKQGENDDESCQHPMRRLARARGMFWTYADGHYKQCLSLRPRAGAKRRPFTDAEVSAWRERVFGETVNDPVKVAVEEAISDFGSAKDFTLWAWYANRIGVNNFLELYFEQKSIMRTCRLRNPVAAFHARLKRFYAAYFGERGGRS